jgi:ATP-binding cassette subfamily B protein
VSTGAGVRRRLLAPEVLQASAMDCGPAALACLLRGFGLPADYARLRQVCQTDVDGTSIDRIEEVAGQLGLDARQVMVPADHLLRPEAGLLPAVLVVLLPGGITHFVVVWRAHGSLVQVMDPGSGRQFMRAGPLLDKVFVHTHEVGADEWREWAGSDEFLAPLRGRMEGLRVRSGLAGDLIGEARADSAWRGLAALDATVRLAAALVRGGGLRPGAEAGRLIAALTRRARHGEGAVHDRHWSVVARGNGRLGLRGAVLVRLRRPPVAATEARATPPPSLAGAVADRRGGLLGRLRPLLEPIPRRLAGGVIGLAALAAAATGLEALLLNGLLHSGLARPGRLDQLALVLAVAGLAAFVLTLDFVSAEGALRMGRRLESEFRMALLRKLPRIADRHLGTWLRSDLAERAHSVALLRELPALGLRALRATGELAVTALALALLYPGSTAAVVAALVAALVVPLLAQPLLAERDVRLRSLEGALSRHYLDALVGATAARAHAAENVLRREHHARLADWQQAGARLQRALVATDAALALAALAFAALLVVPQLRHGDLGAGTLLLVFWALRLPALGAVLAEVVERAVSLRSTLLRLLEPLDAPEEAEAAAVSRRPRGCGLVLRNVSVVAGGHPVLHDITLEIAPGEHVAVLGASGAGKSTLLGLFLGWHAPAAGSRQADGAPLEGEALAALHESTAWLDPAVRLWNESLAANLLYGADPRALPEALRDSCLERVVDTLPSGLETVLGEEGRLLSGGEGQKVRTARAFTRAGASLAVLDEPFRGLERAERRRLLERARQRWRGATLLCATHDLDDTTDFDRVLVLEDGRLVEDGPPAALRASGSRYTGLLEASAALRDEAWGGASWRQLRLKAGGLEEGA